HLADHDVLAGQADRRPDPIFLFALKVS
ncbi:MAG: hypothetical protein UV52_C0035G0016, partial [Parcubacteria group bacterium GW2011_GWD1_42_9]